jgi:molybdopterin-guanine dinucleotide biosynthesis protein A
MSDDRVAAVVLAGGRSARFGRDKLEMVIDGRTLLGHALDAVRGVADQTVVVAPPGQARAVPFGVRVVHDPHPFEGPLVGLATGMGALDVAVDRVIVVGGDMPTLVPDVLRRLLQELDGAVAAVLADEHRRRPLPMALHRGPGLATATGLVRAGERSLHALVDALGATVIPVTGWRALDPTGATLLDVDTPGDL